MYDALHVTYVYWAFIYLFILNQGPITLMLSELNHVGLWGWKQDLENDTPS